MKYLKQNEKDLIYKEICARLPYKVKVLEDLDKDFDGGSIGTLNAVLNIKGEPHILTNNSLTPLSLEEVRPFLRLMSDMTAEEKVKYCELQDEVLYLSGRLVTDNISDMVNWLDSHFFDYRKTEDGKSMIEAGLALKATESIYNFK